MVGNIYESAADWVPQSTTCSTDAGPLAVVVDRRPSASLDVVGFRCVR